MEAKTKREIILEERTPKRAKIDKKDLSKFKMKDAKFEGKFLDYTDKKNGKAGKVPAIHRNLVIHRTKVTCWKGEFLSNDEVGLFDKEAKAAWLYEVKSSK